MRMCTAMKQVEGEHRGDVKLYALSTCLWCMRARRLLDLLGVAYRYVEVDLLNEEEQERVMERIRTYNPLGSFPTMVINGTIVIVGYKEKKIKEVLGVGK